MKYIQSFYQYPVTFSSIGKTIPARSAQGEMKNIQEFTDKEYERVMNSEPFFRELLNKKKIRVLIHIPASYVPASQQINAARDEAQKAKAENEALKARLAELEKKAEQTPAEPTEEPVTEPEEKKEENPVKKTSSKKK